MNPTGEAVVDLGPLPYASKVEAMTGYGLSPSDYVLAGGGFPITVTGVGPIGVIAVSGLPQRKDHELIVAGLCTLLGKSATEFALPPRDDAP